VTPGDRERIQAHVGHGDFFEYRAPGDLTYQDQDDDPVWKEHVFAPDHTRRILRHQSNGDCVFLGPQGCQLPVDVRPLVCRLYPFQYDHRGILGIVAEYCPLHLLEPGSSLIESLGMNHEDAVRWCRQLYAEICLEEHACSLV